MIENICLPIHHYDVAVCNNEVLMYNWSKGSFNYLGNNK